MAYKVKTAALRLELDKTASKTGVKLKKWKTEGQRGSTWKVDNKATVKLSIQG